MFILTDIDHTISDARWRDHMIPHAKSSGDWDPYFTAGANDVPLPVMIDIIRYLSHMPFYDVIGLTGRGRFYERMTLTWMRRQGIFCRELLMRPDGDHTPTAEIKLRLIRERFQDLSKIAVVFEDRDDCTLAFKRAGLNVIQFHDSRGETDEKKAIA